jgi:hypothetical protein
MSHGLALLFMLLCICAARLGRAQAPAFISVRGYNVTFAETYSSATQWNAFSAELSDSLDIAVYRVLELGHATRWAQIAFTEDFFDEDTSGKTGDEAGLELQTVVADPGLPGDIGSSATSVDRAHALTELTLCADQSYATGCLLDEQVGEAEPETKNMLTTSDYVAVYGGVALIPFTVILNLVFWIWWRKYEQRVEARKHAMKSNRDWTTMKRLGNRGF